MLPTYAKLMVSTINVNLNKHMKLDLLQPIQEGVHDPYIFKAVFMAGAPGSGKSTVRNLLFGGMGLKLVDADEVRRAYINLGKGGDYDEYGRIVRKQRHNYAEQRLGIIMDTTAWWRPSVEETTRQLRELGYDVGMVHVFIPFNTSLARAEERAVATGRHVPYEEIEKRYMGLKENIRDYAELFGDAFWYVDNTGARPNVELVKRDIQQWMKQPPASLAAQEWIAQQLRTRTPVSEAKIKKQKVSAGIIITDGEHILLGHVTNDVNWDIPKGGIDPGETPAQAAVRELREETGLRANTSDLKHLGRYNYSSTKDLELFVMRVDQMPNASTLKCTSMFTDRSGRSLPEIDDFAVVPYPHALDLMNKNLRRVVQGHAHLFDKV